ncbi:MAG: DUF3465 domain-containing protein [Methanothrix sp.]|nr:MAG: DUF3465 domain-containing protein [Methanothrix sp.]
MQTIAVLLVLLLISYFSYCSQNDGIDPGSNTHEVTDTSLTPLSTFEDAFTNHKSNIQVKQTGAITAILSDDTDGDAHQRFIVRLDNNQTLLIAHNIDIAPRVPNPAVGAAITFYGEYEWNAEGGVIHWTHKDSTGVHVDGWLEYKGVKYW